MQVAVFPNDPHAGTGSLDDELPELPELPIPRPGEQRTTPRSAESHPRLQSPKLGGGGASLTANDRGIGIRTMAEQQQLDAERFTWELAARLTSGMLANPAHANASVKDAMSVFDQFLGEMQTYSRISEAAKLEARDELPARRGDYFHGDGPARGVRDAALAEQHSTSQPSTAATPPQAPLPEKPAPMKPRPREDYSAIPPGSRSTPPARGRADDAA